MIHICYGIRVSEPSRSGSRAGVAFLLAQLGSHAADEFARALAGLDLTPPLVGILRLLQTEPGWSQQRLADRLGLVPSRIVGFVDDLEARGWITRTRDSNDRRVNNLALTDAGVAVFRDIAQVARAHEQAITAGLDDADRAALLELLRKLAAAQGLSPGVHPGFQRL
jgi:DNA-binding MarR family transcriptional regulator